MKKLILIMSGLIFLSGCSGVKQFTVKEFTQGVRDICNISKSLDKSTGGSEQLQSNGIAKIITDGIEKIVGTTSKTGCSAHVTKTSCSLSCGGSDTPKIGK